MPSWSRPESDPIKARRKQLAEQERLLAQRVAQLNQELHAGPVPVVPKTPEPPVWRLEDETQKPGSAELPPTGRRVLARQRRRDKVIFFLCIFFLVVLLVVLACVWSSIRGTAN